MYGTAVRDEQQWRKLRAGTVGLVPQFGVEAFAAEKTVGAQLFERQRLHGGRSVEDACAAALYPAEAFDLHPEQQLVACQVFVFSALVVQIWALLNWLYVAYFLATPAGSKFCLRPSPKLAPQCKRHGSIHEDPLS